MSRVAPRLARTPGLTAWLPVLLLPPVLVLDAAIATEHGKPITVAGVLSAVVACLPLVVRSRVPFAVLAPLLTAGIVLTLALLEPGDTVFLIPAVALADIAMRVDRRRTIRIGLLTVPCVVVSVLPFAESTAELFSIVLRNVAYCFVALAAGDAVRSRREAVERAGAASEEEALRRLGEERLRIAREVHDVVAHAMVAINVQSGVAAHLLDRDPEQARSALREIKAASGAALTDLRATLGVLRDPDGAAPVAPAADLSALDDLAAGLRAAGVRVELDVDDLDRVGSAVHAAAYRIVQEALTNVLRHAPTASAVDVRVGVEGDELALAVQDDGAAAGAPGSGGNGVRGMRERAEALGGSLEAGPRPEGGWRVAARLPLAAPVAA